jgi:hypothetical protein
MLVIILFHDSGYRCLKHFYQQKVCMHMRHLFPRAVSYNRFVELERDIAMPLAVFIKKVLLGKCTGISFVDSTPLRVCRNQRIHIDRQQTSLWLIICASAYAATRGYTSTGLSKTSPCAANVP